MTKDYVDVRKFSPVHETIPCKDCGEDFYVGSHFAFNYDTWYCDTCLPQDLRDLPTGPDVTVRL